MLNKDTDEQLKDKKRPHKILKLATVRPASPHLTPQYIFEQNLMNSVRMNPSGLTSGLASGLVTDKSSLLMPSSVNQATTQ